MLNGRGVGEDGVGLLKERSEIGGKRVPKRHGEAFRKERS